MGRISLLTCALFFVSMVTLAQINRYAVFFPDKANSPYSVDQPRAFLSDRAIERRSAAGIAISEEDFPVSPHYIDSLKKYNIVPYYTSRWFNAAFVQINQSEKSQLENKSFVTTIELVAPGADYADTPSEPNPTYTPNPPATSSLNTAEQLRMLHLDNMHTDGFTGESVWVALFDGGFSGANQSVAFEHLFAENHIKDTEDFVTGGKDVFKYIDHGTKVLSCLAANLRDKLVGSAYGVDVSLYITGDDVRYSDEFRIEEYNWALAAEKADSSGVDIINSSLGYNTFEDTSMDYTTAQLDGKTAIVTRAAEMAAARGMLVVNSAGNSGNDGWGLVTFPADGPGVLTVGGVNRTRDRWINSSKGPTADGRIKPDVVALSHQTVVVSGSGNLTTTSGTSFSAPLISGLAAGLWQQNPALTSAELRELIVSSAHQYQQPDNLLGYGIPSYNRAVGKILDIDSSYDEWTVYPNPLKGSDLYIKSPLGTSLAGVQLVLYNSQGQKVVLRKHYEVHGNQIRLPLLNLEKGVYILSIVDKDNLKRIKLLNY